MRALLIKCTAGSEDLERANQAFTVATAGITAGAGVSLWLTGDAVWFATPEYAEGMDLPLAMPLAELRDLVIASGTITVCTQCAGRRGLESSDLLDGIRISGAGAFVEEALAADTQALVY